MLVRIPNKPSLLPCFPASALVPDSKKGEIGPESTAQPLLHNAVVSTFKPKTLDDVVDLVSKVGAAAPPRKAYHPLDPIIGELGGLTRSIRRWVVQE